MFKLTDDINEKVVINNTEWPVDMSFDNILRLYEMLGDKNLSDATQIITGFRMLYGDDFIDQPFFKKMDGKQISVLWQETFNKLLNVNAEKEIMRDIKGNVIDLSKLKKKNPEDKEPPKFDFEQDAQYIYASFVQAYGIDLFEQQGVLHWYKFKALLHGLPEDTIFKKVLSIREMPLPKNGKERDDVIKMKKQYALKGANIEEVD